jgi:hypothetical protein
MVREGVSLRDGDGFNAFKVSKLMAWLRRYEGHIRMLVESSPAPDTLYIAGDRAILQRMRDEASDRVDADEAGLRTISGTPVLRLWWD